MIKLNIIFVSCSVSLDILTQDNAVSFLYDYQYLA